MASLMEAAGHATEANVRRVEGRIIHAHGQAPIQALGGEGE